MEKTLSVKGMHCNSCRLLIEDAVGEIKGVEHVSVDVGKERVQVRFSDEGLLPQIKQAIEKEGYRVE
ncbi:MAG: heavy-metal-associated domain-containing protein [Candidatus Diapherotrites archaeon]|nr:heavy-metal-associated domain-containing protein [Candidatus Diapherotrites archaeon]